MAASSRYPHLVNNICPDSLPPKPRATLKIAPTNLNDVTTGQDDTIQDPSETSLAHDGNSPIGTRIHVNTEDQVALWADIAGFLEPDLAEN